MKELNFLRIISLNYLFYIIFTICIVVHQINSSECPSNPNLYIKEYNPWNFTKLDKKVFSFPGRSIVILECECSRPIQWDFTENPIEQLNFVRVFRTNPNIFDPSTNCFKLRLQIYNTGNKVTGKYICKLIEKENNGNGKGQKKDEIFIFVKDNVEQNNILRLRNVNNEDFYYQNPKFANGKLQIPCISTDYSLTPKFYQVINKNYKRIRLDNNNLTWNKTEGFFLKMNDFSRDKDYTFACRIKGVDVNKTDEAIFQIPKFVDYSDLGISYDSIQYTFTCRTKMLNQRIEIFYKKCSNIIECQNTLERPPHPEDSRGLEPRNLNPRDSSAAVNVNTELKTPGSGYLESGVVQCAINGYLTNIFMYRYHGFSPIKYGIRDWKELNKEELLILRFSDNSDAPSSKSRHVYVNQTISFICETSEFAIAEIAQWNFRIGKDVFVGKENISSSIYKEEFLQNQHSNARPSNQIKVEIKIWHSDIEELFCFGPILNSYEWINVSKKLNVTKTIPPTIMDNKKKTYTKLINKNLTISCEAMGDPLPSIKWVKNENGKLMEFTQEKLNKFETKEVKDDSIVSNINFPAERNSGFEGEYICVTKNIAGEEAEKMYILKHEWDSTKSVIIGVSVTIVVLILIVIIVILYKKLIYNKKILRQLLSDTEIHEFLYGHPEKLKNSKSEDADDASYKPYNKDYEIPPERINIDLVDVLGSGQQGKIYKGKFTVGDEEKIVAVKSTKETKDKDLMKALLSEIKIMLSIGSHPNIVNFLGALTQDIKNGTLFIVVELCEFGSLDIYLRKNRSNFIGAVRDSQIEFDSTDSRGSNKISLLNMIVWAYECANGMTHLENRKVIHSDLATRNVLLTSDRTLKITDFGLSRKLYENTNYVKQTQEALPWRWMAIESLKDMVFSSKTDVWSYGILLWEIFTLGQTPWPGESWSHEFLSGLTAGNRPSKPQHTTDPIYMKMKECWEINPDQRPNFEQIKEYFKVMIEKYTSKYTILEEKEIQV